MAYSTLYRDETSRKVIDVAVGILVGLRGCSQREAFDELVRVVHQTGIGIGSIATGLVALASGSSSADHAEACNAWGELISSGRRAPLAATS
jgi:ANTAR domain-containing protein